MTEQKATAAKPKYKIKIRPSWCKGCGICVEFCPKAVLTVQGLDQKVAVIDENLCTGCKMCEVRCPDFAIQILPSEAKDEQ